MHIYDLLLWVVFVSKVGNAVFEVLAKAGETVEHWAWLIMLHISS
jgi:hypothetical protein